MTKKFYADEQRVVIYEGNDNVITNPESRISDVYFHSDLSYMKIEKILTGTVTLPGISPGNASDSTFLPLGTHNQGSAPIVLGYVYNLGVPLSGSLFLDSNYDLPKHREINIVSTNTEVGVKQFGLVHDNASGYSSMNITVKAVVFDLI